MACVSRKGLAALLCLAIGCVGSPAAADVSMSLGEALSMAADHAFGVQAAAHDSLAAERALRVAKTEWFPRVSLTANALGFHPQDDLGIGFIKVPSRWNSIYATNLSLSYPIYTGGKRVHAIRRNRADVGAATSQLGAERLENAHACRSAYLRLLVADRMVAAAQASLARVEVIGRDVGNRFSEGVADSVDVLETELSLRRVQRRLESARTERRNASATLARLVGTPADEAIIPTEPIPEPVVPSAAGMPELDVSERPELHVVDQQLEGLRQERSMVKGGYLPVVNGLGGYAIVRPDLGQPGADWQGMWWAGVTLSWGLNLGGQESARSGQVLERIRSLEARRADVAQSLLLQARIARNKVEEAYRLFELSLEEYDIAADRYRLAGDKARAGTITVNRLVELESELTETQQEVEAARLRYFLAITDYLFAIGSDSLWEAM